MSSGGVGGPGPGVYSPLRQHLSDSESEEGREEKGAIMNGTSSGHYQQFGGGSRGSEERHPTNADNVTILPEGKVAMSPLRRVMFVCSVLLCFLTVVVFLWVMPCSESGQCSASGSLWGSMGVGKGGSSWENSYEDMELKGAINVVNGVVGRGKNLILLFRGDVINAGHAEGGRASSDSGVVLLVGNSGKVGWFITQPRLPTDIDCTLIDVNRDGTKDCILTGDHGLFATLDPTSGTVFWYLHLRQGQRNSEQQSITSVDFPLVLLDLDGDGVNDLLATCSTEGGDSPPHNSLVLISGYSGGVIGQPLVVTQCTSINKLQIDENRMISYTCRNNTTLAESLKVISLENLYKDITNTVFKSEWNHWVVGKQHGVFGQRKEIENQRNVYSIDGRKLVVENQGHCPKNCKVSVQLIDERSGKENISWQYIAPQVYGMVPATLLFNNSANSNMLKHHISGFVLKFWQWNVSFKNTNRFERNLDSNFNIFSDVESNSNNGQSINSDKPLRRVPRDSSTQQSKRNITVMASRLTERVVLVTFNATDFHIVNASQSDVFQICPVDSDVCQPDLRYQENSLLVADIDGDGSQELITYLTSFVCPDLTTFEELPHEDIRCNEDWKLHSTVRVVRLEAELPKLYEAVSHH